MDRSAGQGAQTRTKQPALRAEHTSLSRGVSYRGGGLKSWRTPISFILPSLKTPLGLLLREDFL